MSEISTDYDHQQINHLLGNTTSTASEAYTASFLEWLVPCMSRATFVEAETLKKEKLVRSNLVDDYIELITNHPIILYDNSGRLIQRVKGDSDRSVSISHLPRGIYIVRAVDGMSSEMVVKY